jgi:large subunit ribosomal protein L19
LRAWFILRNVVEGQGIEFMYQLYNPTLLKIEVLRLEKRLDDELYYLRYRHPEAVENIVPFDILHEILKFT